MKRFRFATFLFSVSVILCLMSGVFAEQKPIPKAKSQEISDSDGLPVLLKHLPDWENVRNSAKYVNNVNDLRQAIGERDALNAIDFVAGTEAVTAPYEQGKLLIIEFASPQVSVETDDKVGQLLTQSGQNTPFVYRRIGNYNAFVFDAPDEAAANALLDQVKYEKTIQWLGTNPFLLHQAERKFINETSDLFVNTLLIIVSGVGLAILAGIGAGLLFFFFRQQKRASMVAFSDAGGMTRLNLDDLTPEIGVGAERLLGD